MPNDHGSNAEYKAVQNVIVKERHYRIVLYLLTFALALSVGIGFYRMFQTLDDKFKDLNTLASKLQDEAITRDKETTRYITCIFIVPIEERSPEEQQKCFDQADLPGGLNRDDFSTVVRDNAVEPSSTSSQRSSSVSSSSPNNSAGSNSSQPEISPPPQQPQSPTPEEPSNILPFVEQCITPIVIRGGCL